MPRAITSRRSGLILRGGAMRRESLWFFLTEMLTVLPAANSVALINSLNAAALSLRPFTVVRSHLNWFVKSDQTAALEIQQVGLGMAVVSDQSVAIGVTAVPTPFTDLGSDLWLLHSVIASGFTFISGTGVQAPGGINREIDSKGMRKVEDGQDLIACLENSGQGNGTSNLVMGRILIKLH